MKTSLTVGCLFSLLCYSPLFSSEEETLIEQVRYTPAPKLQDFNDGNNLADGKDTSMPAGKNPSAPPKVTALPLLDFRVQIGANYTWLSLQPRGFTSFEGSLGGAQGLFEYRPMNFLYVGAKLAWREGPIHSNAGKRSIIMVDSQERFGYTFSYYDDDLTATFFSGLGFRYMDEKFHPKHGSSVTFNYNQFYVPVGGIVDYALTDWWTIGAALTWQPQVFPTVSISPLGGSRWILQKEIANFLVEMPLLFTLTDSKRFSIMVNPFYERWKDGHSTAKTSTGLRLGLPSNVYNFWGVDVNFVYAF